MKGATAEDWVKKIKNPNNKSTIIIGASHHLLLTLKKSQNSFNIDSLAMSYLLRIAFHNLKG